MDSDDDFVPRGPHERGVWSREEHDKFLAAVALHPHGPWKTIAALVGTRSVRQVQTHAQKYHEKVNRRARGLQKNRVKVARLEHRVDDAATDFLTRPRGGKGQKRGKYNKRHRDARVAPIPPRPRIALPTQVTTAEETLLSMNERATAMLSPRAAPLNTELLPPPADDEEEKPSIPSELEVFKTNLVPVTAAAPSTDALLDTDDLFSLTDGTTSESVDDSRPTTPSLLLPPSPSPAMATAMAPDQMLYYDDTDDDIVAVEEAPEHALSVGDVPSLNDALDYFFRVMTNWGPSTGGDHPSPIR